MLFVYAVAARHLLVSLETGVLRVKKFYKILKNVRLPERGIKIFSIVANEIYFLPHFLEHYRKMGVEGFIFLVDRSEDGTLEFLSQQPDCMILESDIKFGDVLNVKFGQTVRAVRFADICKHIVPKDFFVGGWGLIADADEFLLLPPARKDLRFLVATLEERGISSCRALMVDFFPDRLDSVLDSDLDAHPLALNPFYDFFEVSWPAGHLHPKRLDHDASVRSRIVDQLISDDSSLARTLERGKPTMLHKIPLVKWTSNTVVSDAHTVNDPPSDKVQLAFAHFKFFPGWKSKVDSAIMLGNYVNGSQKYKPLSLAAQRLGSFPLEGEKTFRYAPGGDPLYGKMVYEI